MQDADFTKPLGTEKRNFFSVMFPYMHGNIWSQARDTENKQKTWHREQNLPVVVLRKANLFKRVVSAL